LNQENMEKICDKITEWNVNRSYSYFGNQQKDTWNCQIFVKEMLEVLGISNTFKGHLGHFLENINQGVTDMIYKDPISKNEITFNSHKELDKFVKEKLRIWREDGESFKESQPEDWRLLKGFDRAFWLMISFTDKEKWSKEHRPWKHGCPFHDPGMHRNAMTPIEENSTHYINMLHEISTNIQSFNKNTDKEEQMKYLEEQEEKLSLQITKIQKDDTFFQDCKSVLESVQQQKRNLLLNSWVVPNFDPTLADIEEQFNILNSSYLGDTPYWKQVNEHK